MALLTPRERTARVHQWLADFRRALPQPARQALIDGVDPVGLLDELAALPPHERSRRYYLALYLLAARFLHGPASFPAERGDMICRLAHLAGLSNTTTALDDMRRMLAKLRWDHSCWAKRGAQGPGPRDAATVLEVMER
ncbi:MAG: hypothetical protein ACRENJ_03875 [Candidatus Eiseniibacteriota bacterium]